MEVKIRGYELWKGRESGNERDKGRRIKKKNVGSMSEISELEREVWQKRRTAGTDKGGEKKGGAEEDARDGSSRGYVCMGGGTGQKGAT
eukprot:6212037-Pleurochrysis_carterae.AAC.5